MLSAERRAPARGALRGPSQPTLLALIRSAARRFTAAKLAYGHGTTNAFDEAVWLALHALHLPLDELEPHLDRKVGPGEARAVTALVDERIRTRKPTAYLTREAWLGRHRFYVDERVIVPRSHIAELLRDDLSPWVAEPRRVGAALDLCTGSGCLAILLALAFRRARVDAADVSSAALEVARRNVAAYRLQRRVSIVASDLFAGLKGRRYDAIVSNPPYVSSAVMRQLPPEHRREPALALAGGRDGLDFVRAIVKGAPAHLNPGGVLIMEIGHNRRRMEAAYPRVPFIWAALNGGDDCVFVITREALQAALRAPSGRATRGDVSPRPGAARSPVRASTSAAGRRRRSARA